MKELHDLLHDLRCDINYCKVSYENDTEIDNTNETLLKVQNLVKKLIIPDVSNRRELLIAYEKKRSETILMGDTDEDIVDEIMEAIN